MSDAPTIRPPMVPLIRAFAAAAGRTVDELRSPRRTQDLVMLRRELIGILDEQGHSVSAIARRINRDHTTVLHHLGRLGRRGPTLTQ